MDELKQTMEELKESMEGLLLKEEPTMDELKQTMVKVKQTMDELHNAMDELKLKEKPSLEELKEKYTIEYFNKKTKNDLVFILNNNHDMTRIKPTKPISFDYLLPNLQEWFLSNPDCSGYYNDNSLWKRKIREEGRSISLDRYERLFENILTKNFTKKQLISILLREDQIYRLAEVHAFDNNDYVKNIERYQQDETWFNL
jgi:hypothetical protein